MFNELRKTISIVKENLKSLDKKASMDEYIRLSGEYQALKAELNRQKSAYYAELAKLGRRAERKKVDHLKFLFGGIVVKYFPAITPAELEKILSETATARKIYNEIKNEN